MAVFENTIIMTKSSKQLDRDFFLPLKSKEDICKELEISRQQAAAGDYLNAKKFISEVKKEYGI